MTLDNPWSDQATAMKDGSEKDLAAIFSHTSWTVYVHFKLQDHVLTSTIQ